MSRWGAPITLAAWTGLAGAAGGCNAEILEFDNSAESLLDASAPLDAATALDADAAVHMDAPDGYRRDDRRGFPESGTGSDDAGRPLGECGSESDCARLDLHCLLGDAAVGSCVECATSNDCPDPALSRCDPTLNRCVQCDVRGDCRADEVCLSDVTHTCIPSCLGLVCPARAASCDVTRNVCLGCTDSNGCDLGYVCDTVSGRCGPCAADTDCHQKPFLKCDRTPAVSRCVECLSNSDCDGGACDTLGVCVGGSPPTEMKGDE